MSAGREPFVAVCFGFPARRAPVRFPGVRHRLAGGAGHTALIR